MLTYKYFDNIIYPLGGKKMTKKYEIINADGTFQRKFRIEYEDVNNHLKLKPQRAIELCQNMAVRHSDIAGYTTEYFSANNRGWVLTGWHGKFSELPAQNSDIEMTSWTAPHKRLQSDRSFIATDMGGKELFKVNSRWFLLDTLKRKPMRIPKGFLETYVISDMDVALPECEYVHPEIEEFSLVCTRQFQVTRRDIDSNNHVNNIAYIEWAFDDLSNEIYENYQISEIIVEYKLEAMIDMTIESHYYTKQLDDGTIEVSSIFSDAATNQYLCRVTTVWNEL